MAMIGYARVSTQDQDTGRQVAALREAGCTRVYEEHASGGNRSRPRLGEALSALKKDDVLVVVKIDRLARSLPHLLQIMESLDRRGIQFKSLGDPIDTTTPNGRFSLQILGAVAEFERALIQERIKSGVAYAKEKGQKLGNPGLVRGDPAALKKLADARDARIDAEVIAAADEFLPIVRIMRPGEPWSLVAKTLNSRRIGRVSDGRKWTRDSIIRAVRRLVKDGLADQSLLESAPKKRTNDHQMHMVASTYAVLEKPTLASIAKHLEEQHIRTPRGGTRWSTGSVRSLLEQAREKGIIRGEVLPS